MDPILQKNTFNYSQKLKGYHMVLLLLKHLDVLLILKNCLDFIQLILSCLYMLLHVYIVAQVSDVANGPLFIIESIESYFVCHIACRVYVILTKYAKTGIESVHVFSIVIDKRINHLCFIPYQWFTVMNTFLLKESSCL